jgi:hypothetical protein
MIVPEPCGYAALLLITIILENRALRPDEKTACSSSCATQRPPSYYTCLSEVFSRQQQGERGRKRREKKRKNGKGGRTEEERRKSSGEGRGDGQTGSTQASKLSSITTGSLLSAIWSATLYPPTRCLRMSHRVRLAALVGSFTAVSKSRCMRIAYGNSRLVISSS